MSAYAEQLEALHNAVTRAQIQACEPFVRASNRLPADVRLRIYRNSYCERLLKVTLQEYPATAHAMGEDALTSHVQQFVTQHISGQWDINRYAAALPGYLAQEGTAPQHVALAELEAAIHDVFWMPDSDPLDAASYQSIAPEQLAEVAIRPRVAHQLLAAPYDTLGYLDAFRHGAPRETLAEGETYTLVYRHENQVQRMALTAMEHALLSHMHTAGHFGAALEATIATGEVTAEALVGALPDMMARFLAEGVLMRESA